MDPTGSPYNLTGNLQVSSGATLTIEAGVTVNLNSYYLDVAGTLRAIGTETNLITINEGAMPSANHFGQIFFTQTSTPWNESTGTGCIIQNAIVNSPEIKGSSSGLIVTLRIEDSPKICNNTIQSVTQDCTLGGALAIEVTAGSPVITGNLFTNNWRAIFVVDGKEVTVTNNTITHNRLGIGVSSTSTTAVHVNYNSILDNYENGLTIQNGAFNSLDIVGNLIQNISHPDGSGIAIQNAGGNIHITNNTVTNNRGVAVFANPSSSITLSWNNLVGNALNLKYVGTSSFDASNNWWGTDNSTEIAQTVYDGKDDSALGTVVYEPFLAAANSYAPTEISAANPAPTPTEAPKETENPTDSPSPTPNVASIIQATANSGLTVDINLNGNITSSQITNTTLTANETTTTLQLTVTGQEGDIGFSNMTIPKTQNLQGAPVIYIDGVLAENQGYTQDANNYYVWYTTHFSTHQVTVVFTPLQSVVGGGNQVDFTGALYGFAVGIVAASIVIVALLLAVKSRKANR
jgi:parallel beta-helix repeat protein